jgi:hypothetical protein
MKPSCNLCEETGFSVRQVSEELEPNTFTAIQCKYCGIASIGKTSNSEVKIGIVNGKITLESIPVKWISLEEYEKDYSKIKKVYESNLHNYWSN